VVDEVGAGGADLLDGGLEEGELGGFEDGEELVEGELVVVAEVEGVDGGIEEVSDEGVGEGGGR